MKNNDANIILIAIIIVIAISGFSIMGSCGTSGMMRGFYGGFGFMSIFGGLFMILIAISLVLLIFWLIKQLQK